MAITLTSQLGINLKAVHQNALNLTTYNGGVSKQYNESFASADVSKLFHDSRTVSSPETLNVLSGLTDGFGQALVYGSVVTIVIHNTSDEETLTVGGGSNALFNQLPPIGPGQTYAQTTSITTSGTVKNILVSPSGALTYDIIIVGD